MIAKQNVYKILILQIDAELTAEGVTTVENPVARYLAEGMTPVDAICQVARELEEEESS